MPILEHFELCKDNEYNKIQNYQLMVTLKLINTLINRSFVTNLKSLIWGSRK